MDIPPQLHDNDYYRFRDLVLERTGMDFGLRRRDALVRGVMAAASRADRQDLGEYYRLLQQAGTDSELWDDLIGTITVGETYFFRDQAQFDVLRQHILPALIARHQDDRRLRIWSAGCATGEEPYSVAILLRQFLPDIANWNILILATDINKRVLQQAIEGRYREWSFRQTDSAIRESYFRERDGSSGRAQDRLFELRPQVREMVTFAYLNLAEDAYPSLATNTNAMDLILCRNVAIYLPEAVTRQIARRFHRCLLPEGWLIVGAAETSGEIYGQFAARSFSGAVIYQKGDTETRRERDAVISPLPRVTVSPRPPLTPSPRLPVTVSPRPPVSPPPPPADAYREGLALLEQGRYEEAINHFRDCIARDPGCIRAYYQMARVHANQGRLEEARSWCQQAIERDPLLSEAHYTLALIHQEEGALDEAIARLKKTLYLDPNFILAHFSLANLYRQVARPEQATRHRMQAIRLAARMPPDDVVPGSDGLTAARLLAMVKATI